MSEEKKLTNSKGTALITVDAALAGFDQGEFITIPALPDMADWEAYEAAREKLIPNLSRSSSAERYKVCV